MTSPVTGGSRGASLALAGALVVSFVALSALALLVPTPRSLADEVRYVIAAGSLADGDGLRIRGASFDFSPAYPTLVAGLLAAVPDRDAAYPLIKVLNALLFTLAAVPLYLLARRLLPPRWSIGVALLSLVLPASAGVSLVMTESAAYPAAVLAILAVVLALERPTVTRQLAVLGTVAVAFLVRTQFAVLLPAFVVGLALIWALVPSRRPRRLRDLRTLWPTLGVVVLGLVVVVGAPLVTGRTPVGLPSAYAELWDSYDVGAVAKLVAYHLADLEIYLAVIPLAVAPIVLQRLIRQARAGSRQAGAYVAAFLAINAAAVLVAAAFASTSAGFGHLHDRYLFYVFPLWLVAFAVWLHEGLPRPLLATVLGVALALVLPTVTPFALIAAEDGQEAGAAVTHLWSAVNNLAYERLPDAVSGRRVLALFVVTLLAVAFVVPRRIRRTLAVASVAGVLAVSTAVAWRDSIETAEDFQAILPDERTWVDEALGDHEATTLYVSAPCTRARRSANALLLTELFNRRVTHAAHVVDPDPSLLPTTSLDVSRNGTLTTRSGRTFRADAIVAATGVALRGRRLATGTTIPLALWDVDGAVRLARPMSARGLQHAVCG